METPNPFTAPGPATGPAPIGPVADSLTAELLRKHSAGEKLTPQQYGKLGAFKARLKGAFTGKGGKGAPDPAPTRQSASPAGPVAGNGQTAGNGLGAPPLDPDLVRRTTAAILQTCDQVARGLISAEARKAGADDTTLKTFEAAVALQPGPRDLMVNTSPEVAVALGLDDKNYPVAAFCTGLGVWAGSLLMAVYKLKGLQAEQTKRTRETEKRANGEADASKSDKS